MELRSARCIAVLFALPVGACVTPKPATVDAPPQPASAQAVAPSSIDSLALARQFTQWFYTNQLDSLWAHHDEESRKDLGSPSNMERSLAQLTSRAGTEAELIEEKFVKRNGRTQYWRTARFTLMSEPVLIRWVIGPRGEIMGLGLGPASQAPPIDP